MKHFWTRKQKAIWTTKDGQKLRICDMADSHLLNTIAFLERSAQARCLDAVLRASEFQFNGEIASEHADNFIANADPEDFLPKIYFKMLDDKARRGI